MCLLAELCCGFVVLRLSRAFGRLCAFLFFIKVGGFGVEVCFDLPNTQTYTYIQRTHTASTGNQRHAFQVFRPRRPIGESRWSDSTDNSVRRSLLFCCNRCLQFFADAGWRLKRSNLRFDVEPKRLLKFGRPNDSPSAKINVGCKTNRSCQRRVASIALALVARVFARCARRRNQSRYL